MAASVKKIIDTYPTYANVDVGSCSVILSWAYGYCLKYSNVPPQSQLQLKSSTFSPGCNS